MLTFQDNMKGILITKKKNCLIFYGVLWKGERLIGFFL